MKVLGVNGSPRKDRGATDMMLQSFLEGAGEAGASCETVYLADREVNECLGCFGCWVKRPGECLQRDDMDDLFPKFVESDVVVFGTPLYFGTMTGLMKVFIDRLLPLAEPVIVDRDGLCTHPSRFEKLPASVLISCCGFFELEHFEILVDTFRQIPGGLSGGVLLRPASEILRAFGPSHPLVRRVLDACRRAGSEVVTRGSVSAESREAVSQELMTRDQFLEGARQWAERGERGGE